jgi:hypothetical protein
MSERDKMSELHDMSADNTAMHIEEASTFMSMAPVMGVRIFRLRLCT